MVDARHPGTVIGLVVLGSERLQAEARTHQALRNDEVIRDEGLSHMTRLRPDAGQGRSRACPGPRAVPTRSSCRICHRAGGAERYDAAGGVKEKIYQSHAVAGYSRPEDGNVGGTNPVRGRSRYGSPPHSTFARHNARQS